MSIKSFFGIREDEPELSPKPEYAPEYAPEIEPKPELKEDKFEYDLSSRPALEELVSDQPTTDPLPEVQTTEPTIIEEPEVVEPLVIDPVVKPKAKVKTKAKARKPRKTRKK